MVELQLLNKVLATKDCSILINNGITKEYFPEYANEYDFIHEHLQQYGNLPDIETFLSKFPEFQVLEVTEADKYLIDTIREENLYSRAVPVIKTAAELLKGNANEFSSYLQTELPNLMPNYSTNFVDIIHSKDRFDVFKDKSLNPDKWFIKTGFEELDDIVGGWQRGEEYVVIFARTGIGKSWMSVKFAQYGSTVLGERVGYMSPEMSPTKIGYRFDSVNAHFSNRGLLRGDNFMIKEQDYLNYFDALKELEGCFLVCTPRDFNNKITVSKLKAFVIENRLTMLFIDGITYLTDERYKRGDSKTNSLTNISEDLMQLSVELSIPVFVVVQSNRGGVEKETPELEDIRDSDGISHNATKVLSLNQKDAGIVMSIKKNRDGVMGDKLTYLWDIDKGTFEWLPASDDTATEETKTKRKEQIKEEYKEKGDIVF